MTRKARLIIPGAVYHIMGRCLDHYSLFNTDSDREYFLQLIEYYLSNTNTACYAWALMQTHYHLVLRSSDVPLCEIFKPLNMRYAAYHAKMYKKRGPLFMDRYKSIATQDQNYLQELIRYVHLNPVRAGVCKNLKALERYPWSGHSALLGTIKRRFQDTDAVLRRFGSTTKQARQSYVQYLREATRAFSDVSHTALIELVRKSNAGVEAGRSPCCWVIGDPPFVEKAVHIAEARRLRINRFEQEGRRLDRIISLVTKSCDISQEDLRNRRREGAASEARKLFAYICIKELHAPSVTVSDILGVGATAVYALARAGRVLFCAKNIVI